jgi:hypothetical protein
MVDERGANALQIAATLGNSLKLQYVEGGQF